MDDRTTSTTESEILICPIEAAQDMRMGVHLQRQIWGYSEIDTVPEHMFIVARESGGQILVAFHQDKPIGFVLAFIGTRDGIIYLHSHLVGVIPSYQNRGIGRQLKLAQRDDAIARGINLIEWTFDPLQLKNAHFNLARLGAIVRRYIPDCYGRTSSPLHSGLPTDRLVAEWWLQSVRVQEILEGKRQEHAPESALIPVPTTIRALCDAHPREGEKIQLRVRDEFMHHLATGCAAVDLVLEEKVGSYVLEPYKG